MIKRCLLISLFVLTLAGCKTSVQSTPRCPPIAYPQLSSVENALRDLDKMYAIYNACNGYEN